MYCINYTNDFSALRQAHDDKIKASGDIPKIKEELGKNWTPPTSSNGGNKGQDFGNWIAETNRRELSQSITQQSNADINRTLELNQYQAIKPNVNPIQTNNERVEILQNYLTE
ncbi:MAG: hypothetical protein IJV56_09320 [Neisseriaceae bacterium]|nr:hypothetical protein [Neisseriaceae bacterium]